MSQLYPNPILVLKTPEERKSLIDSLTSRGFKSHSLEFDKETCVYAYIPGKLTSTLSLSRALEITEKSPNGYSYTFMNSIRHFLAYVDQHKNKT